MSLEVVIDKAETLPEVMARRFEQEARRAIAAQGRFAVALPGGSVARAFFPRLAAADVDWTRTDFFWGDERGVPPEDPESNYGLARSLWLEPARVPADRIHRMEAEASDLEKAAAAYEDELLRILGAPPRLDFVLLGVGADGHVCSLFPGHPLLLEQRRWVAAILDSPKPPPRRLTVTLPLMGAAHMIVVAALGREKAEVLREVLDKPASSLPLALVTHRARRSLFLLDPTSAGERGAGPLG